MSSLRRHGALSRIAVTDAHRGRARASPATQPQASPLSGTGRQRVLADHSNRPADGNHELPTTARPITSCDFMEGNGHSRAAVLAQVSPARHGWFGRAELGVMRGLPMWSARRTMLGSAEKSADLRRKIAARAWVGGEPLQRGYPVAAEPVRQLIGNIGQQPKIPLEYDPLRCQQEVE